MNTDDKDEIVELVKTVLRAVKFFGWLGAILGASAFGVVVAAVAIAVSDHYDQIALRKESDWMMPRVTQLWYHDNKRPASATPNDDL